MIKDVDKVKYYVNIDSERILDIVEGCVKICFNFVAIPLVIMSIPFAIAYLDYHYLISAVFASCNLCLVYYFKWLRSKMY